MNGKIAGVAGWPVAQSLSPVIHRYWFDLYGVDGSYVALAIEPENFSQCMGALPLMGFAGINVTVPHKQAAFALATARDEDARRTGAVNLLIFGQEGISGANTDVRGFAASLADGRAVGALQNRTACVLGAGGAARAVILALQRRGVSEVRIVNRTRERAAAVAQHYAAEIPCQVVDWGDWQQAFEGVAILVNTTSLGMRGKAPLAVPLDALPESAAVADIVYNPVETDLLHRARARGHATLDGLGMLMHQAVPAFAALFGVTPEVTAELRARLIRVLQERA